MKNSESRYERYQYPYVITSEVAKNIDEYVIPECQSACKSFWRKGITTCMCSSNASDETYKYILIGGKLSEKNQEILEKLIKEFPEYYYYDAFRDSYGIRLKGTGEKTAEQLEKLTRPFEMQDITEGVMTPEMFLIEIVGLSKTKLNPGLNKYLQNEPKIEDFADASEYVKALNKFMNLMPPQLLVTLDKSKMEKSFEEYLSEYGFEDLYDSEDQLVFRDKFYMDAHTRYKEYLKSKKEKSASTEYVTSVADLARLSVQNNISMKDIANGNRVIGELNQWIEK